MAEVLYEGIALIDSSAAIALFDETDQYHAEATAFFEAENSIEWVVLNVTSHETFTRYRYSKGLVGALRSYDFMRSGDIHQLGFDRQDEADARGILGRYSDQTLSFHDALCAAVMRRVGIFKVFTFDRDFWILGFQVIPGYTR